ncbi:hypothetical protein Trydic_g23965 [Trypoxylus dichotomus]
MSVGVFVRNLVTKMEESRLSDLLVVFVDHLAVGVWGSGFSRLINYSYVVEYGWNTTNILKLTLIYLMREYVVSSVIGIPRNDKSSLYDSEFGRLVL